MFKGKSLRWLTGPAASQEPSESGESSPKALASILNSVPWMLPVAVGIAATFTTNNLYLHLIIMWAIYSIITLSLNVIIGFTGLLALGQAAFYGIGAYTSAIAVMKYNIPYPVALLLSALVPFIIGFLLALPFMRLRLRGIYLGMATFGFGEIAFLTFRNWESMTGGTLGMSRIPAPQIFGFEIIDQRSYAYLAVFALLIVISVVLRLLNSTPGQVLLAVRDDELAASSSGIPTLRYQVAAFSLSAAIAGIAGSLFAHYVTYLSPENFTSNISILVLAMLIVGGRGNVLGSLLGAGLLLVLPETLRTMPELRLLAYGTLLLVMSTMRPQGILGDLQWGQRPPKWIAQGVRSNGQ
jgi:branched-chain amino acid transport system permease protein